MIVPDAGKYALAYAAGDQAFFGQLRHLGGAVTALDLPMLVLNQTFRMGATICTPGTLQPSRRLCGRAAFHEWNCPL